MQTLLETRGVSVSNFPARPFTRAGKMSTGINRTCRWHIRLMAHAAVSLTRTFGSDSAVRRKDMD